MITVTIPGPPKARGMPRAYSILGKARVYIPKKQQDWKYTAITYIEQELQAVYPSISRPIWPEEPIRLSVWFCFPCPKSKERKRKPFPGGWHTLSRDDLDNLLKSVMDAGTNLLWKDDGQICELNCSKFIAEQGAQPFVMFTAQVARLPLAPTLEDGAKNTPAADGEFPLERICIVLPNKEDR